jgi:hypothetical protein
MVCAEGSGSASHRSGRQSPARSRCAGGAKACRTPPTRPSASVRVRRRARVGSCPRSTAYAARTTDEPTYCGRQTGVTRAWAAPSFRPAYAGVRVGVSDVRAPSKTGATTRTGRAIEITRKEKRLPHRTGVKAGHSVRSWLGCEPGSGSSWAITYAQPAGDAHGSSSLNQVLARGSSRGSACSSGIRR